MSTTRTESPKISDTIAHNLARPVSSSSKDARALRSAIALRDALLALLERKPFEQITVRHICTEAGVHYATFFRHHATKESLLEDIAKNQIDHLHRLTLAVRQTSDFRTGFHTLCTYVDDHRALWSTLLNGGAAGAMREEWVRVSKRVAAVEPPVNSWLPVELGTVCAATLIAETLAWWVAQPSSAYSVDEVADILIKLLQTTITHVD